MRQLTKIALVSFLTVTSSWAQDAERGLTSEELETILSSIAKARGNSPNIAFDFDSQWENVSGFLSVKASSDYSRSGSIRHDTANERFEATHLDTDLSDGPGNERLRDAIKYVWSDGQGLGSKENLATKRSDRLEYFTQDDMLHDAMRPDLNGWFTDGIAIGDQHFIELLSAATGITGTIKTSDAGERVYWIDGESELGTMNVSLSVEEPYLLQEFRFEANAAFAATMPGVENASIEVTDIQYEDIDGIMVATSSSATYTFKRASYSEPNVQFIQTTRSNIELAPDFEALGAFKVDIPDGAEVLKYRSGNGNRFFKLHHGELVVDIGDDIDAGLDKMVAALDLESSDTVSADSTENETENSYNRSSPSSKGKAPSIRNPMAMVVVCVGVIGSVGAITFIRKR